MHSDGIEARLHKKMFRSEKWVQMRRHFFVVKERRLEQQAREGAEEARVGCGVAQIKLCMEKAYQKHLC